MKKIKKNHKVVLTILIGIVVLLLGGRFVYSTYFVSSEEKEKIAIDTYNFEQLKKVREVLKDIPEEEMKFRNLKELNNKYNADIIPKENCYYAVTTNYFDDYEGESSYIFGFRLESDKYQKKYGDEYYAYPKYDLPPDEVCAPSSTKGNPFTVDIKDLETTCSDFRKGRFRTTTSNPCKD